MEEDFSADKSDWEQRLFGLVLDLGESQADRYMAQTTDLLKSRSIEVPIRDSIGQYELGLFDCQFLISHDNGESFLTIARTRVGWRKKDKERYLPAFFAQTEASVLLQ
jgi:hypothetical protein